MMEHAYYLINHYTAFLYTVIYKNDYFFIDYWSFVHLILGFTIILLACYRKYTRPFVLLLSILFSWEITEISFIFIAIHVFRPETIPDQFTDMFIGIAGGLLSWNLRRYRKKGFHIKRLRNLSLLTELSISCMISFLWVISYGYTYNVSFFNSPVINWLAFVLWSLGLFVTMQVYKIVNRFTEYFWTKIALTWLIYFSSLLIIEYTGYYVLEVHMITSEGPLIFGLIHGTVALKIFYIFAGISAVIFSRAFEKALQTFGLKNQHIENSILDIE